jgi:hypothetical protein
MSKQFEIMGQTVSIDRIHSSPDQEHTDGEDKFNIWLTSKEGFANIVGFGISIPAKEYKPEEFLKIVKKKTEVYIKEQLETDQRARARMAQLEERRLALDKLASRIMESLG